ncbi:MAG TPA: class I SAM-dependent methyltransferase [Gemmataceae bacterium]|nr:class I SAM-dependent methyltransferase [Gemmataceae bacterium]
MDEHLATNRRRWDELAPLHAQSAFYDLAGFEAGASSLKDVEIDELGDVTGQSLLHLQCHIGVDTLSWARRGARVTGVDFSEVSIRQARALAAKCGMQAEFVCSAVEALPDALTGQFDIIFTSYGVLCWLEDLNLWGRTIAHFLNPGGVFYIVESHPFADVFNDTSGPEEVYEMRVTYPYFTNGRAIVTQTRGTYADRSAAVVHDTSYQWSHTLGEILNAVLGAGLHIEFLHEFPICFFAKFPGMTRGEDGWWRLPGVESRLPLLFSLKATKPA